MKIAIIIPVLNESDSIVTSLQGLQGLRSEGHEVIVVDGGSKDNTVDLTSGLVDKLVQSEPGRGKQMNRGAEAASAEVLLFLHADTILPPDSSLLIARNAGTGDFWGRFDIRLSGQHPLFRLIESLVNLRSSLSGIATGDQAIFVTTTLFQRIGAYPEIALMEDIALSDKLKTISSAVCIKAPVITSSRRWEQHGIFSTIFKMWKLRALYALGHDPDKLARLYE